MKKIFTFIVIVLCVACSDDDKDFSPYELDGMEVVVSGSELEDVNGRYTGKIKLETLERHIGYLFSPDQKYYVCYEASIVMMTSRFSYSLIRAEDDFVLYESHEGRTFYFNHMEIVPATPLSGIAGSVNMEIIYE